MPPPLSSVQVQLVGNRVVVVGEIGQIPDIAAHAFSQQGPTEFAWFAQRESSQANTYAAATALSHLHETAWSLAHLFYDQTLKESAARKTRLNLAHPAFGVAQLAQQIGHAAGVRHFSMVAQLADVLGEDSPYRGGAFHFLSNRWGRKRTETFIAEALQNSASWNGAQAAAGVWPLPNRSGVPIYPEALLAAHWLPSRRDAVLKRAEIVQGIPFVASLVDQAEVAAKAQDRQTQGTLFEAAVSLLLSVTPGFEVRGGHLDASSQTDVLAVYKRDGFSESFLPEGYLLVECKHWREAVDVKVVREFATRLRLGRHAMGIIVTKKGITGEDDVDAKRDAELVRHDLMVRDGIHMLSLSLSDIQDDIYGPRGLERVLKDDLEFLRFGLPA